MSDLYLSRGIDYLGSLGAKLRDLQGYRTLAHELIQNADDAEGATSMVFDARDDALVVDNDGVFSDCGQVEVPECPWKESRNHRCDFHRFRLVASGDKRDQAETTGAFGVGFIAVYQITDRPELISNGRHWIVDETQHEDQRIRVCLECPECTAPGLPGTRFIFPWAVDPDSELRKRLRVETVPPNVADQIVEELRDTLSVAMLFLRRIKKIEVRRSGSLEYSLERLDEGESLILSNGNPQEDQVWHLVRGDFDEMAWQLRKKHPNRIEAKRSSRVIAAIPAKLTTDSKGVLCAGLPTEHDIGLPFHIYADFFPTSDRKRIVFAGDYQSEWNREALRAAARAVGEALTRLPQLLGCKPLWRLLEALQNVSRGAEQGPEGQVLAEFWKQASSQLKAAPVIFTTKGEWTTASKVCLLQDKEEAKAISALESLGIELVHEDLRPYQSILRSSVVGIPLLGVRRISAALEARGFNDRTPRRKLEATLGGPSALKALWTELSILLNRGGEDKRCLHNIALAPGRDGALWPCGKIYRADEATIALFESMQLDIPFLAGESAFEPLEHLCPSFDAAAAIDLLERIDPGKLERLWRDKRLPLQRLFEWFADRRKEIADAPSLKARLAALPLFPSAGTLRPLSQLALPGQFQDPLGLADIVDLEALGEQREFLRSLGCKELSFREYVITYLSKALGSADLAPDKRRQAVALLARHIGELKDGESALQALKDARLIECADGEFRAASDCYFDSKAIREILPEAPVAVLPPESQEAIKDLYKWLGVAEQPRLESVVRRAIALTSGPYASHVVEEIQRILAHLADRVRQNDRSPALNELKFARWLPARGKNDRWYRPDELYAAYQDYLFESQALFLDVPRSIQSNSSSLFDLLGMPVTPPVSLVVKHLLYCSGRVEPVNEEVYRFLNRNVYCPEIEQLQGRACLYLGEAYYAPDRVFWGEHPFGRYRLRLDEKLRAYSDLLTRLGVAEQPTCRDALSVLQEISEEYGKHNRSLDDETYAVVVACWRLIGNALANDGISQEELSSLRDVKCIPNCDRILCPPQWMFFENRAGLAAKFGEFLRSNVIPRPLEGGEAMIAAGVRLLGDVVRIELLEHVNPVEDAEMVERITSRRNAIGRVLLANTSEQAAKAALERLPNVRCLRAESIKIRYRVQVFNRDHLSPEEEVPALFQRDDRTLLFVARGGKTPWGPIARELAMALCPKDEPGRYALGLKGVLEAESAVEAVQSLDELGLPLWDTSVTEPVQATETIAQLGRDGSQGEDMQFPTEPVQMREGTETLTPEKAEEHLLGGKAPGHGQPTARSAPELIRSSAPVDHKKPPTPDRPRPRPVLRTYVPKPEGVLKPSGNGADEEEFAARSAVDQAGIEHVLAYERARGRDPELMPPGHHGYDIQSRDAAGRVVRYIEVKSFSGEWRDNFADLSRKQFDCGAELGDKFWLYVVERAGCEDYRIHPIQGPVCKANHFMFDDGWRELAEASAAVEERV